MTYTESCITDYEAWLRRLAKMGGKGVVNNIDARSLGRIADELAHQYANVESLSFQHTLDQERIEELTEALNETKRTIRALHGEAAWDIYDANSPEMKKINAALGERVSFGGATGTGATITSFSTVPGEWPVTLGRDFAHQEPCGCITSTRGGVHAVQFCALHKAAPYLRQALTALVKYCQPMSGPAGMAVPKCLSDAEMLLAKMIDAALNDPA